jgi:hypothetical protein
MTDITPSRINIQSEETAYKASVSEATLTRVGASTNFVNRYQFDSHAYNYNYLYKKFEGVVGADGVFFCWCPVEVVGCAMWNRVTGTSGSTTVDVHSYTGASDNGTIFSTKPSIASTATGGTYFIYDAIDNTDIITATGITPGRFSTTRFAAGTALVAILDAAMPGAEDMCFRLFYRPINASEV